MTIRFPTEAANADVMGEDPDTPGAKTPAGPSSPYARPRPGAPGRADRPSGRAGEPPPGGPGRGGGPGPRGPTLRGTR